MNRFVVDSSMAIAWVHEGQATTETEEIARQVEGGCEVVVPVLWFPEVANVLLILLRRKKITDDQRHRACERLLKLGVTVDSEGVRDALGATGKLAHEHGLSVYDACYLELAVRLNLPLATLDGGLRDAAKSCGIQLLPNVLAK